MTNLIKRVKALRIYAVMCRFFDFQIHFASIYLNNDSAIGFQILTFENCNNDRSLLAIMYDTFGARLFVNVLWFQFKLQL
jgi:hypothetical protein